jgi:hypothetical protein
MSKTKHTGKGRRSKKVALSMMGVAGVSLVATTGTTTTESVAGTLTPVAAPAHSFTLSEEEISDVTLATFNVLDKMVDERSLLTQVRRGPGGPGRPGRPCRPCGGRHCGGRHCGGGGCGGCGGGCGGCLGGCWWCLSAGGCQPWC